MKVYNFSAHRRVFPAFQLCPQWLLPRRKDSMRPNNSSKAFYSPNLKFPNITSIIFFCSRLLSSLNPDSRGERVRLYLWT